MLDPVQDEEAELLAELERIKKERAAEAARKAAEEAASEEASAKDELIRGNPLILGGAASFQVGVARGSFWFSMPHYVTWGLTPCGLPLILGGAASFQVGVAGGRLLLVPYIWFPVPHARQVSHGD